MKLTTGILAMAMMVSGAWGQNPDAIDNARSIAKSLQQKQANDSNAALNAAGVPATGKPAPGAPAPAVKPAVIPGSKPAPAAPASAAAKPAPAPKPASNAKPAAASAQHNQLQHVNVLQSADNIQIEISSSQTVMPRVSKLSSPARVLVELPETVIASSQSKIPVGSGGVKGVRIGMDGKTPPTTSVVVDLEKALQFELTPGSAGKLVLTLHTQGGTAAAAPTVAKNSPVPAKASAAGAKPQTTNPAGTAPKVTVANAPAGKAVAMAPASKPAAPASAPQPKQQAKAAAPKPSSKEQAKAAPAPKLDPKEQVKAALAAKAASPAAGAPAATAVNDADAVKPVEKKEEKKEDKKWAMSGKRDPFISPVVQQQSGSGCSTGKKCLEINSINLRGVVKSDNGFIAVVTNSLNKAYFLRENDPVFNGYVVKITGDSVVFQETIQDKLGKPFTREVVKKIFTPAV